MRFAIFPVYVSKVLRLPRKIDARPYEVLHLSCKIILANLQIWCSKMQPPSGNQRPDPWTSLMNMSLVLRLPRDMNLCRSSSNVPRLPSLLELLQNPHVCSLLARCRIPCTCHAKSHLNLQEWPEHVVEICFAPQPRTHFQHLNFQKCSEAGVVCTFWFRNLLRARTAMACTFLTSQLPKVFRPWCVCRILTWKCASRNNGVHFQKCSEREDVFLPFSLAHVLCAAAACNFLSLIWPDGSAPAALASLPCEWIATFLPFRAPASSFFWLFLFSDLLLLFSSLTLPTSAFPSVHIVGSLTSKLPYIIFSCI